MGFETSFQTQTNIDRHLNTVRGLVTFLNQELRIYKRVFVDVHSVQIDADDCQQDRKYDREDVLDGVHESL